MLAFQKPFSIFAMFCSGYLRIDSEVTDEKGIR